MCVRSHCSHTRISEENSMLSFDRVAMFSFLDHFVWFCSVHLHFSYLIWSNIWGKNTAQTNKWWSDLHRSKTKSGQSVFWRMKSNMNMRFQREHMQHVRMGGGRVVPVEACVLCASVHLWCAAWLEAWSPSESSLALPLLNAWWPAKRPSPSPPYPSCWTAAAEQWTWKKNGIEKTATTLPPWKAEDNLSILCSNIEALFCFDSVLCLRVSYVTLWNVL